MTVAITPKLTQLSAMARLPRVVIPGLPHDVIQRGQLGVIATATITENHRDTPKVMYSFVRLPRKEKAAYREDFVMKRLIISMWDFIFNHEKSPLRHIPDFGVRHMVFQLLGWMWAVSFSLAIGSYSFLAVSMVGHAILIGAMAITVATYTVAATRPKMFMARSRR